jgi:hypothetical protein
LGAKDARAREIAAITNDIIPAKMRILDQSGALPPMDRGVETGGYAYRDPRGCFDQPRRGGRMNRLFPQSNGID